MYPGRLLFPCFQATRLHPQSLKEILSGCVCKCKEETKITFLLMETELNLPNVAYTCIVAHV